MDEIAKLLIGGGILVFLLWSAVLFAPEWFKAIDDDCFQSCKWELCYNIKDNIDVMSDCFNNKSVEELCIDACKI